VILPIWCHCAVCIYGACLKWLLPELSFSDRWSRGTKTLETRLRRRQETKTTTSVKTVAVIGQKVVKNIKNNSCFGLRPYSDNYHMNMQMNTSPMNILTRYKRSAQTNVLSRMVCPKLQLSFLRHLTKSASSK